MKCLLTILIALASLSATAQNTYTITGNVVDERKAPLSGATVFLAGTKNIVASDSAGNFSLNNLAVGDYHVVVKVVGYKPLVKPVALRGQIVKLTLQLEPDPKYLKSVTVRPDRSWLDHLETFKTQFLGESDNAGHCKIVNPGALNFEYDKNTKILQATSDELLVIRNPFLGYQLKYLLLHFVYDGKRNAVSFQGYPSFEELKGTPEEEKDWKTNRRLAFRGSIHHFIRSVYDQNCKAEGFVVFKIRNRAPFGFPNPNKHSVKVDYAQVSFDSLLAVVDDHHKVLDFQDALYVIYAKDKEPPAYTLRNYSLSGMYVNRRVPIGQISIVNLFGPVTIDEQGSFQPTTSLYFEGFMGWRKIGDLVPFEYDPTE